MGLGGSFKATIVTGICRINIHSGDSIERSGVHIERLWGLNSSVVPAVVASCLLLRDDPLLQLKAPR